MTSGNDTGHPAHDQIFAAVNRICNSEIFKNSDQLRKLLVYLVTETLEGRSARIKSYSIALDVFGRPPDFDGSRDAIARTTASRLRTALEKYYAENHDEPLVISLPKGRYVPEFATPASSSGTVSALRLPPSRMWIFTLPVFALCVLATIAGAAYFRSPQPLQKAVIFVSPVETLPAIPYPPGIAVALTDRLATKLVTRGGADIVELPPAGTVPDSSRDPSRIQLQLTSSLEKKGDTYIVSWKLTDLHSQRILWAVEQDMGGEEAQDIDRMASSIAGRILGIEGVLPSWLAQSMPVKPSLYQCLTGSPRDEIYYNSAVQLAAASCLEQEAQIQPGQGEVWALLSLIYYSLGRNSASFGQNPAGYRHKQHMAADKARALAPQLLLTKQAVMFSALADGQLSTFRETERQLLSEFPGDAFIKFQIGHALAAMGEFDEALPIVKQAIEETDGETSIGYLILAYKAYIDGNYEDCIDYLYKTGTNEYYIVNILRTAALAQLGQMDMATAAWNDLLKIRPNYNRYFAEDFRIRNVPKQYYDLIADGLKKIGIPL